MKPSNALVLGGGGVTGVAWELGLLLGLQERGVDLTTAEQLVGTSAGAVVAAQFSTGRTLAELYATQLEPVSKRKHASLSRLTLVRYAWAMLRAKTPLELGQRMGRLSLGSKTETEAERRVVFEQLLGANAAWPERLLQVSTIHATSGAVRIFDKTSGASLIDAVGASAAVPGVWPAVTIQGERYIDGGMVSGTHANLAQGKQHIVIIAPLTFGTRTLTSPFAHKRALEAAGAQVVLLTPDALAKKVIGRDVLSPRARAAAARAGYEQAARVVESVASICLPRPAKRGEGQG